MKSDVPRIWEEETIREPTTYREALARVSPEEKPNKVENIGFSWIAESLKVSSGLPKA
jgi:hypothetical protein